MDWDAENVTLSFFTGGPHSVSPATLFKQAFGSEPVSSSENLHPQMGRVGNAASRPVKGFVRALQLQPGRIDIALQPAGEEATNGGYPEKISDFAEGLSTICSASKLISATISQANRIALNIRFSKHYEKVEEANGQVQKILPTSLNLTDERDLLLQLNYRASEGGYALNRIIRWSSEPVQVVGSPFPDFASATLLREFWAAVVHLDFNTIVPRPIFKTEELTLVIDALQEAVTKARKNNLRMK